MNNSFMWKVGEKCTDECIELRIYGDVTGDRVNWWTGETIESETSAKHLAETLEKYPDAKQINIYINSYGGSVYEGTAIYNQLKRCKAHKTVYIDGFACSVASVIAMAGNEVIMPENTLMMIHNMWLVASGNAAQLRKAADDLDIINKAGRAAYMERAAGKITEEELTEMMDAETWLTAEDCVRYGFADTIKAKEADMSGNIKQYADTHPQQAAKLYAAIGKLPEKEPDNKLKEFLKNL